MAGLSFKKFGVCVSHSVVSDSLQPHGLWPGSSVHGILQARTLEWVAKMFGTGCLFWGMPWGLRTQWSSRQVSATSLPSLPAREGRPGLFSTADPQLSSLCSCWHCRGGEGQSHFQFFLRNQEFRVIFSAAPSGRLPLPSPLSVCSLWGVFGNPWLPPLRALLWQGLSVSAP